MLPGLRVTAAAQASAVRTVPAVELPRYMGDWFEIARYPNRFQAQCVGDVRVTYGLGPMGASTSSTGADAVTTPLPSRRVSPASSRAAAAPS